MDLVSPEFWQYVDRLVAESEQVIARPRGSAHPRYPEMIYPRTTATWPGRSPETATVLTSG